MVGGISTPVIDNVPLLVLASSNFYLIEEYDEDEMVTGNTIISTIKRLLLFTIECM